MLHFVPGLAGVFDEARRVLVESGLFAFTTRLPATLEVGSPNYEQQTVGAFEMFSHAPGYIEMLLEQHAFTRLKLQKCFVGDDLLLLWIVRRQ